MESDRSYPVNSRQWWDRYFQDRWEAEGGRERTRCWMETLIASLPAPERSWLDTGPVTILDWGCGFGEGVAALAREFPRSAVTGLDSSARAVEEARHSGHDFILSEHGEIPRKFDAIVNSGRLQYFEQPLAALQDQLASCNSLYLALVPYTEIPLNASHQSQFRLESFPPCVTGFVRLHAVPIPADNRCWPGRLLLLVYASEKYILEHASRDACLSEPDSRAESMARFEARRIADSRKSEALVAAERRYAEGLQEFDYRFQKQLAEYRTQRAWRAMLAIRRAYTLLARRKWRGVAPFLRWALDSALGRENGLEEFELKFPDVLNFVPESVYQLVANHRGRPAGLERRIPCNGKYDVVILPIFDFECRFQRPQQMAIALARRGHRVFWISPSRFVSPSSEEAYEPAQLRENLWEIHLRGEPFDLYGGALSASTATLLLDSLSQLYKDLALSATCAILQFPSWRQIGMALRERFGAKLIYDCMDDWRNWPSKPKPGARSLSDQDELVRESNLLIVTSRELRDSFAKDGATAEIIPNAADFEFFQNSSPNSTLDAIPGPVVGYYGAIADWFDLNLMAEVAASRPQYSFVLIGQVTLDGIGKLKNLPNVHLLGEKPYRELPAYLRQFAVCTLPFRMNQLTRAVDPVKIYEYLSQGKPVVSVPLPELSALSELLSFAQGPAEFAEQIDRAVVENDESLRQKRISFASQNTWASRVEALDRAIRMRSPLVSILLLTYNSGEYIGPCLDSIRDKTAYPCYEIIAVDNHSGDGTANELKRRAADDPRIHVACLDRNHGFAGGNNIAAAMAKGEYILFLNPDTVVTWGWLDRLMRPLRKDPTIGLVAPVSNFSDTETKVNTYYRTLPEMEDFAFRQAREKWGQSTPLEVAPLFCGLVPRKVWREVGQLDETFQIGMFEDDDFSFRVRKAGYRIVTAEDCFVHHFGHGSFGKLDQETFQKIYEENKRRFEAKWGAWPPHKTRQWVTSPLEDPKIPLSEFFSD